MVLVTVRLLWLFVIGLFLLVVVELTLACYVSVVSKSRLVDRTLPVVFVVAVSVVLVFAVFVVDCSLEVVVVVAAAVQIVLTWE